MTTIAEQVEMLAASVAAQPPNAAMAVFAEEQTRLAESSAPGGVVGVGAVLADVELLDVDGAPTTLYAAADGPAVLVFYRGAWCPYCNITLNIYQSELVPALAGRNVALIAVSPQSPDGSLTMRDKNALTFTVLSDPGSRLIRAAGVVTAPTDEVRAAQLSLGLDLTAVNADGTTELPMPTTVVLDADHVVRWVDVHPDYSTRSEPTEILAALDAAGL